jgi:hypothetical protein
VEYYAGLNQNLKLMYHEAVTMKLISLQTYADKLSSIALGLPLTGAGKQAANGLSEAP